jgi:heavy-metal resistance protein CzcE
MRKTSAMLLRPAVAAILSGVAGAAYAACGPTDLQGMAVPTESVADRTVAVSPNMKDLSVKFGETVKFVMPGGKETSWRFIGTEDKIPLGDILATGAGSNGLTGNHQVYVAQAGNPMKYRCVSK